MNFELPQAIAAHRRRTAVTSHLLGNFPEGPAPRYLAVPKGARFAEPEIRP